MIDAVQVGAAGVRVSVTMQARHLCPFVDETDDGELTVVWETGDLTVEMHSLRRYVDTWAGVAVSHEELVSAVFAELAVDGVIPVGVAWVGRTAGAAVSVRVGAADAVLREPV